MAYSNDRNRWGRNESSERLGGRGRRQEPWYGSRGVGSGRRWQPFERDEERRYGGGEEREYGGSRDWGSRGSSRGGEYYSSEERSKQSGYEPEYSGRMRGSEGRDWDEGGSRMSQGEERWGGGGYGGIGGHGGYGGYGGGHGALGEGYGEARGSASFGRFSGEYEGYPGSDVRGGQRWQGSQGSQGWQGSQGGRWQGGQESRMGRSGERWQGMGQYRGIGPRGYRRSDERIREEVCERLTDDDELDASNIDVIVTECEVKLSGTVNHREDKRRAEQLAEDVSGVKDVQNSIRVQEQRLGQQGQQGQQGQEEAERSGSTDLRHH